MRSPLRLVVISIALVAVSLTGGRRICAAGCSVYDFKWPEKAKVLHEGLFASFAGGSEQECERVHRQLQKLLEDDVDKAQALEREALSKQTQARIDLYGSTSNQDRAEREARSQRAGQEYDRASRARDAAYDTQRSLGSCTCVSQTADTGQLPQVKDAPAPRGDETSQRGKAGIPKPPEKPQESKSGQPSKRPEAEASKTPAKTTPDNVEPSAPTRVDYGPPPLVIDGSKALRDVDRGIEEREQERKDKNAAAASDALSAIPKDAFGSGSERVIASTNGFHIPDDPFASSKPVPARAPSAASTAGTIQKPPFNATPLGQELHPSNPLTDPGRASRTPGSPLGGFPGLTRDGGVRLHQGLDDQGPVLRPTREPSAWSRSVKTLYTGTGLGKVTAAGDAYDTQGVFLGRRVTIEYRDASGTWESTTMHHRDLLVKTGDTVYPGQTIATGAGYGDQFESEKSGAPHVHWTLKHNGVLVNPLNGEIIQTKP